VGLVLSDPQLPQWKRGKGTHLPGVAALALRSEPGVRDLGTRGLVTVSNHSGDVYLVRVSFATASYQAVFDLRTSPRLESYPCDMRFRRQHHNESEAAKAAGRLALKDRLAEATANLMQRGGHS
jgi:hypothetical protein